MDVDATRRACEFASAAHAGPMRASGEEYDSHTVEVAAILAQLHLDNDTIVARLIQDATEDTQISVREVESRFGAQVASIVDGVTKLGRVQFCSATEGSTLRTTG